MRIALLMLLFPVLTAAAEDATGLGRLFHSAEERARLDANRPAPPAKAERVIRLDGILKTSEGASTIWLDGEARRGPQPGMQIGTDRIRLRNSGRIVEIPVGGEARLR